MLGRAAAVRTVATRAASKRAMSSEPKMHKAKDLWPELVKTRPVDPHPHPVFEPPYNKVVSAVAVTVVVVAGYGLMYGGMRHQQYKQGYWK